jgi:hypothetical protein
MCSRKLAHKTAIDLELNMEADQHIGLLPYLIPNAVHSYRISLILFLDKGATVNADLLSNPKEKNEKNLY